MDEAEVEEAEGRFSCFPLFLSRCFSFSLMVIYSKKMSDGNATKIKRKKQKWNLSCNT